MDIIASTDEVFEIITRTSSWQNFPLICLWVFVKNKLKDCQYKEKSIYYIQ